MKLVIITTGETFGGVEQHIVTAAPAFKGKDVDVRVLLFAPGELLEQLREKGIEVDLIPKRFAGVKYLRDLCKQGAAVFHVHGYKANTLFSIASMFLKPAMVKTVHSQIQPLKLGSLKQNLYEFLDLLCAYVAKPRIVFVSDELKKARAFGLFFNDLSQEVIYNGVPEYPAYQSPPEYDQDRYEILLIGRIIEIKGIDIAIRSMAQCAANLRLNIVGDGPLKEELERLVESLGLEDSVRFLGYREHALPYIQHCDCMIIPSFHEGLPYVLLEALSLSKPIIASDVGGMGELLTDTVTASLIPPNDPESLGSAITKVAQDKNYAEKIASAGQALFRNQLSLSKMIDQYIECYQSLVRTP